MFAHTLSPRIDVATLTPAQRDGVACAVCAGERGYMVPVDMLDGIQLFAHASCVSDAVRQDAAGVVLVVGDASTPDALDDLTMAASDVADRMGMFARVAVGRQYNVADYESVVLVDGWMNTVDSVVLGFEAMNTDMQCLTLNDVMEEPITDTCGHCGEKGAGPLLGPGLTWTPSVCQGCADAASGRPVRLMSLAA
ncbi:hypothetical protein ABZ567_11025 [Streptomyces sp. NPDC016459]|uniref:hypothetical protein n=1 Tax=Streptomyces sp. NPDC016459 TaxID=3157190 RepID=UPI0034001648